MNRMFGALPTYLWPRSPMSPIVGRHCWEHYRSIYRIRDLTTGENSGCEPDSVRSDRQRGPLRMNPHRAFAIIQQGLPV